jgi:hypothetical protein
MGGKPKAEKATEIAEKTEVCMTTVMENETVESIEQEMDKVRLDLELIKKELEEKKAELKKMPAREIDAKEQAIIDKQISGFAKDAGALDVIAKQKAYDDVKITGKFLNRRAPGQAVKLTYMKYSTDPVKWYTFEDGKVYTIPRGFVDQIKTYYHTPKFIQRQGPMDPSAPQSQVEEVDKSNTKYDFVPLNF